MSSSSSSWSFPTLCPRCLADKPHTSAYLNCFRMPLWIVAEVLDCGVALPDDHGLVVVWQLPLGLGVDAHELQPVPDHLHQAVQVPLVVGADGAVVGHAVKDVELLEGDLVDLVDDVDGRDVDARSLDDVDQVVGRHVVRAHDDIGVVHAVLLQDGLALVQRQGAFGLVDQPHAALLLLAILNVGRRLVQADAEPLQLLLDNLLVRDGLHRVQADQN